MASRPRPAKKQASRRPRKVAWPTDKIGQLLSIRQEMTIRRLSQKQLPIAVIAESVRLPEDLVRAVIAFGEKLASGEEKEILWFGERLVKGKVRCPRCRRTLTIWPCRCCRIWQYKREQRRGLGG
jgi:hypothetical protein